ncbi:uncharacterized mitochondrial protein AtMg00810-like [Miscanthus floridulus]|uniref:uncharacterized mitochondrial protein AtMg00810-like n=1 Tax=Miscanthus floridulus TaxID=154761 RepID=UPI0034576816
MSDLNTLSYYLGIEVRQGKEALMLGQSAYASKLLEWSGMAQCKPYVTPMEERLKLTKATASWSIPKRIKGAVDQVIVFPKTGGSRLQLAVFSDTDMAGDIDGRRSTSGVLVFLGLAPISWLSLKQKVVAMSTCEAEYVAAATAACQAMWLRWLLGELTGVEARPPALVVDN